MDIEGYRFLEAGYFSYDHINDKFKFNFKGPEARQKKLSNLTHVVYTHTVDGEIVYIGETSNTLHKRMYYYCNHKGATNVRVREYFKDKMYNEQIENVMQRVKTYVYQPKDIVIEGNDINPYVGLEQFLINKINPILNKKNVMGKVI